MIFDGRVAAILKQHDSNIDMATVPGRVEAGVA